MDLYLASNRSLTNRAEPTPIQPTLTRFVCEPYTAFEKPSRSCPDELSPCQGEERERKAKSLPRLERSSTASICPASWYTRPGHTPSEPRLAQWQCIR